MKNPLTWRILAWSALVLGWLYMLLQLWSAFATFPTAERLDHSRLVAIPSLGTLALLVGRSLLELGSVLAMTWPWRARLWLTRVWGAALLLAGWFLLTTPLSLSGVMWVHRRWMAATVLGLAIIGLVGLLAVMLRRVVRRTP